MREVSLWLAYALLLALMFLFTGPLWAMNALATFLLKQANALDFQLLLAGAERRTRNERKKK